MNAENFSSFLQDPSKLYQIPYQELKSLVVAYPYCQPLRILLLQKSQMEQHPDFERNLQAAATYLPDRTLLFFLIQEFQALDKGELLFELEEERLELKTLSEILAEREEQEIQAVSPELSPPATTEAILDLFQEEEEENLAEEKTQVEDTTVDSSIFSDEEPGFSPEPVSEGPTEAAPPLFEEEEPAKERPTTVEPPPEPEPEPLVSGSEKVQKARPAPQPKSAFSSWENRYEQLRRLAIISDLPSLSPPVSEASTKGAKKGKSKKKKSRPPLAKVLAKRSVEKKEGIVTETLADILARQGHTHKAISMYKKLSLIFPEKSSFFAQKIENLKRK